MVLFQISLLPALLWAELCFHSVVTLSSATKVVAAFKERHDSDLPESYGEEHGVSGPPPVTTEIRDEQFKVKDESKQLSVFKPMRDGQMSSLRGHAPAKPGDGASSTTRTLAGEEEMSHPSGTEALEEKDRLTYSFPTIPSRIPLNLTLPPLLRSRSSALRQATKGEKELNSAEAKKDVRQPCDGAADSIHCSGPAFAATPAKEGVKSVRPKATRRRFHFTAADLTEEDSGVNSVQNGASESIAGEEQENCSDGSLPGRTTHRGEHERGVHGFAYQGPKRRKSKCGSTEGVFQEDPNRLQLSDTEVVTSVPPDEQGYENTKEFDSDTTTGKLKRSAPGSQNGLKSRPTRYTSLFPTAFVPTQPIVEVTHSSSPSSPYAQHQTVSDAPKVGCRESVLSTGGSHLLLSDEPVTGSLPQAALKMPKVVPQLKYHKVECTSCRCRPTCECPTNEEQSGELGTDGLSTEPSHLEQYRRLSSEVVRGTDESGTDLEVTNSEETDQVKRVRGPLPTDVGARVRGEPLPHENLQSVARPTLHSATSSTEHQILHRSSSTFPTPLGQLEELFLNVEGQFRHSPEGTELLHSEAQRQQQPAGDGTVTQE